MFWWGLIAGIAAALLIGEISFRRYVIPRICAIFENVPPFNVVPEPGNSAAQRVEFRTGDGLSLRGSLWNGDLENSPGLIVFMPELKGTHWMAARYCQALIEEGFTVLSFDFRDHGESDRSKSYSPIHWMTEFEMADVEAALEFVESHPKLSSMPMMAFGVSRGGVAALLSGCRYPRIRGVIADSAFGTMAMTRYFVDRFVQHVIPERVYRLLPDWHVQLTLKQAVQLSERRRKCSYVHLEKETQGLESGSVLLISGGRDSYVTPEIARRLQDMVGHEAELWIADKAKHNMSRSVQTAEYDRRVLAHARRCLCGTASADRCASSGEVVQHG